MLSRVLLFVYIICLIEQSLALTELERLILSKKLELYGVRCQIEYPLTFEETESFKAKKFPENGKSGNAACFTACVFKQLGIIDNKGNYVHDKLLKETKYFFSEDDQKNFSELLIGCDDEVNKVKDNEKGCERSRVAYNCLIKHAPEHGFEMKFE